MSAKSRTKGKSAELEVCALLREHGPWPDAERDLEQVRTRECWKCHGEGTVKRPVPTSMYPDARVECAGPDCNGTGTLPNGRDIINTEPCVIQVKRRARITPSVIETGWQEALVAGDNLDYSVCIHRSDRQPWRVTMSASDFFDLAGGGCPAAISRETPLVEMDFIEWCQLCRMAFS